MLVADTPSGLAICCHHPEKGILKDVQRSTPCPDVRMIGQITKVTA
jgi:hypothetical protein